MIRYVCVHNVPVNIKNPGVCLSPPKQINRYYFNQLKWGLYLDLFNELKLFCSYKYFIQ